jgi:hypothetical protein
MQRWSVAVGEQTAYLMNHIVSTKLESHDGNGQEASSAMG